MTNTDPTINDVLEAVNNFATETEVNFSTLKSDVSTLKSDVSTLKSDVLKIQSTMVTKDYLDDKLADLNGDLVVMMRKEDAKVTALAEVLRHKKVLTEDEFQKIVTLQPFPRLAL